MSICILLRWLLEPVNHPIVSSVAMRFCFASIAWMLRGITRPEIAKKFRQLLVALDPDPVGVSRFMGLHSMRALHTIRQAALGLPIPSG